MKNLNKLYEQKYKHNLIDKICKKNQIQNNPKTHL